MTFTLFHTDLYIVIYYIQYIYIMHILIKIMSANCERGLVVLTALSSRCSQLKVLFVRKADFSVLQSQNVIIWRVRNEIGDLTNITFKASDTFATGDGRINDMIKEKLIMLHFYYLDSRELRTWISSKISGLFWIACIFSVIIKSYARHHDCLHGLLMISPTKTLNQICGDVVGNLQFVHPHLR